MFKMKVVMKTTTFMETLLFFICTTFWDNLPVSLYQNSTRTFHIDVSTPIWTTQ